MVEPIAQGGTAFLIAGEVLNFWQGIGVILVFSGIFIVQNKAEKTSLEDATEGVLI